MQSDGLVGLGWLTRQLGSVPCSGTPYTIWRPNFAWDPLSCLVLQFLSPMPPWMKVRPQHVPLMVGS